MVFDLMKEINYEQLRSGFLKYTRKAFGILPRIEKPRILDIGCGSGIPTMELARLSDGEVIGVDIDQPALGNLNKKAEKIGLANRVKGIECSMFELNFSDESFDIIWAEGAIAPIGFKKGLKVWGRVLKRNGFMVLHDDLAGKENKLSSIPKLGYQLVEYFELPEDAWWEEYYSPLEKRIKELRVKYNDNSTFLEGIKSFQDEISAYKKTPQRFRSIFYILKKV
ncbi:MAG: class I SAM-dependent methyltransferase [Promethearchaeota archaeon]|nr:MAG: class I SAM-dependent methyltransferase [Candidatus Lokiarchaeota archaeon]